MVFDFDKQSDTDFLAMELIRGTPLSLLLKTPMPDKEILTLGMQLADGLAAAHSQGVIHCDLKRENLMVLPGGRLKILDFGLAMLVHPERDADVTRTIAEFGGSCRDTPIHAA
jgi:serine/threonine protein kinase